MSDYHRPPTTPTARKEHRCVWCYCVIPVGERYVQNTGFFEGRAYVNRYHHECFEKILDDGGDEFTPGEGVPPARILELTKVAT